MVGWDYLIRFEADDGEVYFSPIERPEVPERSLKGYPSFEAVGDESAGKTVTIRKMTVPADPVMWYKPRKALAGPGDVPIPAAAQDAFLNFEGELTIVTSKAARDVSFEEASDYILGYTIGNDLTARKFQDPKRAGGQFTRAKAFDNFAPVGPVLASAAAFGDVEGKQVCTKVNGKVMQNDALDLIHGPAALVIFLSKGTTLPAGTLIMTGTPSGVGWFQKPP